jgi:hypothetical protein
VLASHAHLKVVHTLNPSKCGFIARTATLQPRSRVYKITSPSSSRRVSQPSPLATPCRLNQPISVAAISFRHDRSTPLSDTAYSTSLSHIEARGMDATATTDGLKFHQRIQCRIPTPSRTKLDIISHDMVGPPAAPMIFNELFPVTSSTCVYANQYRFGCHSTAGILLVPVAIVCTTSPVSA